MVETASSTEEIVEGSAKLGVPKMKSPKGRHKIFKQTTSSLNVMFLSCKTWCFQGASPHGS